MTVSTMELKLQAIRNDTGLSRKEKIAKLEKLRTEARRHRKRHGGGRRLVRGRTPDRHRA